MKERERGRKWKKERKGGFEKERKRKKLAERQREKNLIVRERKLGEKLKELISRETVLLML